MESPPGSQAARRTFCRTVKNQRKNVNQIAIPSRAGPSEAAAFGPGNPGEASSFGSKAKMRASPEATSQNKTRAAEILGVSLKTLHNKLKEYSQSAQPA